MRTSIYRVGQVSSGLLNGTAWHVLALCAVAGSISAAAEAQAGQTKANQSPSEALTTEQEIKSGQNACEVTNGRQSPADCSPVNTQAITVTGSRIRRPNLDSPLPVTSVGGDEFFQTGDVSIGDKLAELPSIARTFTQANSTRFLGTAGLNLLDLRNLGTARTLVLVNGRRHVGGDVLSTGVSTDVNTIPTDLIDRVDVVTGGNSAVYGSDAIAGVVNFVLKDHYQGLQLRGQGGVSKYGDGGAYFISGLAGKNFADGRGNLAVNVEYARRDQAWGDERDWYRNGVVLVDPISGGPERVFYQNVNSATYSNTGVIRFGPGGSFGCGTGPDGTPYNCPYTFTPTGQLIPITGTRVGAGPDGSFIGGNGENFVNGNQLQVLPQLSRINLSAVGHFEVSTAVVPFFEATFSRTDSVGTGDSGPAFINGSALGDLFQYFGGRNRELIQITNPYLTQQAVDTICGIRAQRGQTCPSTYAFGADVNLLGLGARTEKARRDTLRIVGGVRGNLSDGWSYEASVNYGQLNESTRLLGTLDTQRMLLAMDAVRDPATGQIVCRSQIDPSAAFGGSTYAYSYAYGNDGVHHYDPNYQQRLAADVAACVPVNAVGGQFTPAQRAYLLRNTTSHGKTQQFDATAFISGDSSRFFNLPGGPVGIVLGAEYRTDNLAYDQDPQVQLGYTFYNSIPTFKAPREKVKEGFGEIRIPIVKDLPLLRELEVDGAARVSNYNLGTTGTVWAYNANLIYSPITGLRFRGNYARAIRAPNQSELFTPFGQNYTPGPGLLFYDPCDASQISSGTSNRTANCAAAGIPAGTHIIYSDSLPYLSGGNSALQAETSRSLTFGAVATPRFLPGFSVSVDYYSITVKNAISYLNSQFVLNSCYDLPTLNNVYCGFFQRAGAGSVGHDAQPFGIIDNSLHVTPFNFAKLTARGIDTEIAFRHQLGGLGRLDTKLNYTHVLERTDFTSPDDPNFGDRLLGELGTPQDAFNWNTSLQHGRFTFGYQLRFIGKMVVDQYEDWFTFEGRPPQDPNYSDKMWYPAKWYHDVRLGVDVGPRYNFYLGVDNLTNVKPPYGLSGIGGQSAIYDAIGRFYYAGVVAKF